MCFAFAQAAQERRRVGRIEEIEVYQYYKSGGNRKREEGVVKVEVVCGKDVRCQICQDCWLVGLCLWRGSR